VVTTDSKAPVLYFAAATLIVLLGVGMAVTRFPGGFDWAYTVISRLGSARHNPAGAPWLSGSLLVATALLWPVARHLARPSTPGGLRPCVSAMALRVGLMGGALLGLEGLFQLDLSRITRKGHEILALATFLGMYWGVLGLHVHRVRHAAAAPWPALLVVLTLCAVGVSQLALYVDQRDLGWVNTGWREMGVPLWLSFAFWQWLAVAFLGAGLGSLLVRRTAPRERTPLRA
jgi:hypothetical protein